MNHIPARYVPDGRMMAGGMGSVTVCQDTVLERPVAIKFVFSTSHSRRMADEVAALLKLRSKHVVQVYDVLRAQQGQVGMVQEFIDGKDLVQDFKVPASVPEYFKKLWQIASGISDIHEVDVIHRDIKPNNMKTDPEGVIKIFDFGLAREDGPSAQTRGFIGTQGFAAPELYVGPFIFTKAVDTYAFGATALYLATGGLPNELLEQPPRILSQSYFSGLPLSHAPEVAALLNRCLAASPSSRPAMKDVRDALAAHLLFNRHRALLVHDGSPSYLDANNRTVNLAWQQIGSISISYDGMKFLVSSVSGEVQINSRPVVQGMVLPGACVVALGDAHRRNNERQFITFDISHPEIVL